MIGSIHTKPQILPAMTGVFPLIMGDKDVLEAQTRITRKFFEICNDSISEWHKTYENFQSKPFYEYAVSRYNIDNFQIDKRVITLTRAIVNNILKTDWLGEFPITPRPSTHIQEMINSIGAKKTVAFLSAIEFPMMQVLAASIEKKYPDSLKKLDSELNILDQTEMEKKFQNVAIKVEQGDTIYIPPIFGPVLKGEKYVKIERDGVVLLKPMLEWLMDEIFESSLFIEAKNNIAKRTISLCEEKQKSLTAASKPSDKVSTVKSLLEASIQSKFDPRLNQVAQLIFLCIAGCVIDGSDPQNKEGRFFMDLVKILNKENAIKLIVSLNADSLRQLLKEIDSRWPEGIDYLIEFEKNR